MAETQAVPSPWSSEVVVPPTVGRDGIPDVTRELAPLTDADRAHLATIGVPAEFVRRIEQWTIHAPSSVYHLITGDTVHQNAAGIWLEHHPPKSYANAGYFRTVREAVETAVLDYLS